MAHRLRLAGSVGLALALVGAIAGCGGDVASPAGPTDEPSGMSGAPAVSGVTEEPTQLQWEEQEQLFASVVGSDYVVTFDVVSSLTAEAGPIRVEVLDGRARTVDYPDAATARVLPVIPLLTVGDFFDRARAVLSEGGLVEIEFDDFDGHPTVMNLDPIPNAIDDELSIVVRSVEPTDPGFAPDGY